MDGRKISAAKTARRSMQRTPPRYRAQSGPGTCFRGSLTWDKTFLAHSQSLTNFKRCRAFGSQGERESQLPTISDSCRAFPRKEVFYCRILFQAHDPASSDKVRRRRSRVFNESSFATQAVAAEKAKARSNRMISRWTRIGMCSKRRLSVPAGYNRNSLQESAFTTRKV